ncbi:MAG: hypothetical protein, partial [Olavius algarvensis Gamma 1 endosymbiont]
TSVKSYFLPQMNANQRKSVAIDSGSSTLLGSICVYLR